MYVLTVIMSDPDLDCDPIRVRFILKGRGQIKTRFILTIGSGTSLTAPGPDTPVHDNPTCL